MLILAMKMVLQEKTRQFVMRIIPTRNQLVQNLIQQEHILNQREQTRNQPVQKRILQELILNQREQTHNQQEHTASQHELILNQLILRQAEEAVAVETVVVVQAAGAAVDVNQ